MNVGVELTAAIVSRTQSILGLHHGWRATDGIVDDDGAATPLDCKGVSIVVAA
jgi:hypothetical protein